jgi:hypothetical protein
VRQEEKRRVFPPSHIQLSFMLFRFLNTSIHKESLSNLEFLYAQGLENVIENVIENNGSFLFMRITIEHSFNVRIKSALFLKVK